MESLLVKIKVIKKIVVTFPMAKGEFISHLRRHIHEADFGLVGSMREAFSGDSKPYRGIIRENGFEIKMRQRLMESGRYNPTAEGTFIENDNKVKVSVVVNGMIPMQTPVVVIGGLVSLSFLMSVVTAKDFNDAALKIFSGLVLSLVTVVIPWYFMRRSVRTMTGMLERDLLSKEKVGASTIMPTEKS